MDVDAALMKAWDLGMDDSGWTDQVMEQAEALIPTLQAAGYVDVDNAAATWRFTEAGVARAEELEKAEP